MSRVAIGFRQTRNRTNHGMHACLTGLRFADGREHTVRRGRKWTIQKLCDPSGREMLYILEFYLPRFLDQPFNEKLATIVHELWHVSPHFNGDVRRHKGRCYVHGSSQKAYDAQVRRLVRQWLAADPDPALYAFLKENFQSLRRRHGRVHGLRISAPKLIPLD
jgi:predicted metallopeptidase